MLGGLRQRVQPIFNVMTQNVLGRVRWLAMRRSFVEFLRNLAINIWTGLGCGF